MQDVHNPDPGRDGRRGAGARRAKVPDAGSWWSLPRIKGPPSTGREIWSLDSSQLGLKLPNTSLGTYPQIFKSPNEFLVGVRQWPRSYLGPGLFPGQRSFHKLPGPSRGAGSMGRVAPHPRQALPNSGSLGGRGKPRRRSQAPPGVRPEGAPHAAPSRGIACVLAAPPPAQTGGIATSEEMGFRPHIPHLRARISLDRGSVQRPHTFLGELPATCSALRLEGPSGGYACRPCPGLPRRPVSPSHLGVQDGSLFLGDLTTRASRGHIFRHEVGQCQERGSGVLPLSSPTSCHARGWGFLDFLKSRSRGVRWRRPIWATVRPP